jgi:DNA-binding XRE family transcriptional regulator
MKTSFYSSHYDKLRAWLKQGREDSGITLRELAPAMGAHWTTVGKIEQARKKIEILEFVRYCQAIGVDPHEGLDVVIRSMAEEM